MMKYFIGVDIGTTHTKAVVSNDSCQVFAEIKKTYPSRETLFANYEQDADDLLETVLSVMKEAIASVADKEQIVAIIFSSAMHSIMAIDGNGTPITPLYTWVDIRSHQQAKSLRLSDDGKRIFESTGTPVHAMSPLCKIAWLREEYPSIFQRASKYISGKEYLFYKLFGEFVIDYSLASATGFFDFKKQQWFGPSLGFAGIDATQLSNPVAITHALTSIKPFFKAQLGLINEVPFVIGSSDGVLANIGSGAVSPGEAALTIGTSGALRSVVSPHYIDPEQRLFNYTIHDGYFLCGGAINNGGIVLKWFVDVFGPPELTFQEAITRLTHEAGSLPAGADGLIFLPYILGERAPVWDAAAKGAFVGISADHTKAHFFRAVLEGIAFSLRQVLEALESSGEKIHTVYASGGFIESSLWLQIVTDVLGKEISVSYAADASALGAIFLGMKNANIFKEWKEVKKYIRTDKSLSPDLNSHSAYTSNYQVFSGLYRAINYGSDL